MTEKLYRLSATTVGLSTRRGAMFSVRRYFPVRYNGSEITNDNLVSISNDWFLIYSLLVSAAPLNLDLYHADMIARASCHVGQQAPGWLNYRAAQHQAGEQMSICTPNNIRVSYRKVFDHVVTNFTLAAFRNRWRYPAEWPKEIACAYSKVTPEIFGTLPLEWLWARNLMWTGNNPPTSFFFKRAAIFRAFCYGWTVDEIAFDLDINQDVVLSAIQTMVDMFCDMPEFMYLASQPTLESPMPFEQSIKNTVRQTEFCVNNAFSLGNEMCAKIITYKPFTEWAHARGFVAGWFDVTGSTIATVKRGSSFHVNQNPDNSIPCSSKEGEYENEPSLYEVTHEDFRNWSNTMFGRRLLNNRETVPNIVGWRIQNG